LPPWYLPKGTIYANEDQLEAGSSSCERWAIGFGTIVVIAVIAELVLAVVHPSYDSPWERWGSATADALIALGIVGEVLFGMWDGRIQTELRDRSNKKVADATARAAEAIERAAEAELQTERLRAQFSWCSISIKQRNILYFTLRSKRRGTIILTYLMSDTESQSFVMQLSEIFIASGWKIDVEGDTYVGEIIFGLFVDVAVQSDSTDILVAALSAAELMFTPRTGAPWMASMSSTAQHHPLAFKPETAARLYVGPKEITQAAPTIIIARESNI
jgi:hypothetical protein